MKKIKNARNNFWGPCQVLNIYPITLNGYIYSPGKKIEKIEKKSKKLKKLKIFGTISGALARSLIRIYLYTLSH